MPLFQLVTSVSDDQIWIDAVLNVEGAPPESFAFYGFDPLYAGSDDLMRMTAKYVAAGFEVNKFTVVNRLFKEVAPDVSTELQLLLHNAIDRIIAGEEMYHIGLPEELYVNDVRLMGKDSGREIVLSQEGVVYALRQEAVSRVLAAVNR